MRIAAGTTPETGRLLSNRPSQPTRHSVAGKEPLRPCDREGHHTGKAPDDLSLAITDTAQIIPVWRRKHCCCVRASLAVEDSLRVGTERFLEDEPYYPKPRACRVRVDDCELRCRRGRLDERVSCLLQGRRRARVRDR
jgi:hypothetical protein